MASPPCGATMTRLEQLRDQPLTSAQRMLVAKAWEQVAAASQAAFLAAPVAATRATERWQSVDVLEGELALMLRRSDPALARQLWQARAFLDRTPTLFSLYAAGQAHWGHLAALEDLTSTLTVDEAQLVDEQVAERATRLTVAAFRRVVRRAVAAIDPHALRRRHERAKQHVGVGIRPEPDGMASLKAFLPAPDAIAALAMLNACADQSRTDDDARTHGQRQVDAMLEALERGPASPESRGGGRRLMRRRRAEIGVLVGWRELLGLREGVAHLDRYGPVPAQMVRDMLADTRCALRRLVYDETTGDLRDYSARTYRPDGRMLDLLAARDVTCRYPGCQRPASACDCEHRETYAGGGPTSMRNNHLLCRRHHNRKTHDGFGYRRPDDEPDDVEWTTPLGFTYRQRAASYQPDGPDSGDTARIPRNPTTGSAREQRSRPPPF